MKENMGRNTYCIRHSLISIYIWHFISRQCLSHCVGSTKPPKDVCDFLWQLHFNFHFIFVLFLPFPQLPHTLLPEFYKIEGGKRQLHLPQQWVKAAVEEVLVPGDRRHCLATG